MKKRNKHNDQLEDYKGLYESESPISEDLDLLVARQFSGGNSRETVI